MTCCADTSEGELNLMGSQPDHVREIVIHNPLGFHMRPIQRFAELARAFRGDIQVQIEDRTASGKSVMGLMSLGGRHGSVMKVLTVGEDARQAAEVLTYLVENDFFVEDVLGPNLSADRHVERVVGFASCFDSGMHVMLDGRRADARDAAGLTRLGLAPDSAASFHAEGTDGGQAQKVMTALAKNHFYVNIRTDTPRKRTE